LRTAVVIVQSIALVGDFDVDSAYSVSGPKSYRVYRDDSSFRLSLTDGEYPDGGNRGRFDLLLASPTRTSHLERTSKVLSFGKDANIVVAVL
jgi:hypothetical protein